MSFKKKGYVFIKKAISKELANFINRYLLIKMQAARTMQETRYIMPGAEEWGIFGDKQVPGAYAAYGDCATDSLLERLQSTIEKHTKLQLYPTYSYTRVYFKGNILHKHTDRFSCEVSATLFMGGDDWPIYLEKNNKTIKIKFKPGDMLLYKGGDLPHWRYSFEGQQCSQVFLHYNTADNKFNKFDGRPHLGLPPWFKSHET